MKRKYQVFISSTYNDLIEERVAVMKSLLKMDCIPVGMEQFPASDMGQMEYIQLMLDDCDYYILILAGKYGSLDKNDISFTEEEYDYAVKKKIPVLSFIIEDPNKLISEKCESDNTNRSKLEKFRKKVSDSKLVRYYTDCASLCEAVTTSLHQCIIDIPAIGWVRGNNIESTIKLEKILENISKKRTISKEEIEDMFAEDTFIFDGGSAQ